MWPLRQNLHRKHHLQRSVWFLLTEPFARKVQVQEVWQPLRRIVHITIFDHPISYINMIITLHTCGGCKRSFSIWVACYVAFELWIWFTVGPGQVVDLINWQFEKVCSAGLMIYVQCTCLFVCSCTCVWMRVHMCKCEVDFASCLHKWHKPCKHSSRPTYCHPTQATCYQA